VEERAAILPWALTGACGFVVCLLVSLGLGGAAALLDRAPQDVAEGAVVQATSSTPASSTLARLAVVAASEPEPMSDSDLPTQEPPADEAPPAESAPSRAASAPQRSRPNKGAAPPRTAAIAAASNAEPPPAPVVPDVTFQVRAGPKSRGVAVAVDGRAVGVIPLSTRVQPGSRTVRFFNGNAGLDLTCTIEVGESGRTLELDARRATCP
jgi:hypothetical protein